MARKNSDPRIERARQLRREMTIPERRLWNLVRNRQLANLKFRRQVPLGPFIVDFFCQAAGLVVELDGASHDGRGEYDKRRQQYIEDQGIRVLRIQNQELMDDPEAVLYGIARGAGIDLRKQYGSRFGASTNAETDGGD